jgi:hypothetical protein
MAEVTLDEPDRVGAALPDVCMKCGRHAPGRTFLLFPIASPWLVAAFILSWPLLPFAPFTMTALYVTAFLLRRLAVKRTGFLVPLCPVHGRRVFRRFWGLPVVAGLLLLTAVICAASPPGVLLSGLMRGAIFGLGLCVLVGVMLHRLHWPRTSRVTDLTITLAEVSPDFVRAYEESRRTGRIPTDATSKWRGAGKASPRTQPAEKSDAIRGESGGGK